MQMLATATIHKSNSPHVMITAKPHAKLIQAKAKMYSLATMRYANAMKVKYPMKLYLPQNYSKLNKIPQYLKNCKLLLNQS